MRRHRESRYIPTEYRVLEYLIIPVILLILGIKILSITNDEQRNFSNFVKNSVSTTATVKKVEVTTMSKEHINADQISDTGGKVVVSGSYEYPLYKNVIEYNIDGEDYESNLYSWDNKYSENQKVRIYCSNEDLTFCKIPPMNDDTYMKGILLIFVAIILFLLIGILFYYEHKGGIRYFKLRKFEKKNENYLNNDNYKQLEKNNNQMLKNVSINNNHPMGSNYYKNSGYFNNKNPMSGNSYNNSYMNDNSLNGRNGYNSYMNNNSPNRRNGYNNSDYINNNNEFVNKNQNSYIDSEKNNHMNKY